MIRLAVFASGSGSNFQAIVDSTRQERVYYAVRLLIAEKPDQKAVSRAFQAKIPVEYVSRMKNGDIDSGALAKLLSAYDIDLIALAGFIRKIPKDIIDLYPERILNIHPSLLPKFGGRGFYGMHVHKAVLAAGESVSGCTVHLVNPIYDDGRILAQASVEVLDTDTPESLQKRILTQEHRLYPKIINEFAQSLTHKI